MADAPRFKRRTILVKRSLQLKYIGLVFASVLVASLIVGGDIYITMSRMMLGENPAMAPLFGQFDAILLVKIGLYLAIILLISLFVSHRFAGPVYRFEKSAQTVATGDLTHRVSLRTGDELVELQEEFNHMVGSLQAMVLKDRNLAARLAERVEAALRKAGPGEDQASLREDLASLKIELEHLTKSFRV
jgi:methyl-accepting chemotaxis protein